MWQSPCITKHRFDTEEVVSYLLDNSERSKLEFFNDQILMLFYTKVLVEFFTFSFKMRRIVHLKNFLTIRFQTHSGTKLTHYLLFEKKI